MSVARITIAFEDFNPPLSFTRLVSWFMRKYYNIILPNIWNKCVQSCRKIWVQHLHLRRLEATLNALCKALTSLEDLLNKRHTKRMCFERFQYRFEPQGSRAQQVSRSFQGDGKCSNRSGRSSAVSSSPSSSHARSVTRAWREIEQNNGNKFQDTQILFVWPVSALYCLLQGKSVKTLGGCEELFHKLWTTNQTENRWATLIWILNKITTEYDQCLWAFSTWPIRVIKWHSFQSLDSCDNVNSQIKFITEGTKALLKETDG